MLVERYVRAVCERGLDVDSILVITYTRKAAGELRSRIRAALLERGRPRSRARARRRLDLDDPRLLQPAAEGASVRGRPRPALPRARRDAGAAVLRGEAFERALDAFCAGGEPERLRLLATYRAAGLRRMLRASTRRCARPGASSCSSSASARASTTRSRALRAEADCARGRRGGDGDPAAERGRGARARGGRARARSALVDLSALAVPGRARRVVRAGAQGASSGPRSRSSRRATATCSRSCSSASPPSTRRPSGASRRRLRGPPARRARPAARRRRRCARRAAALPDRHGRRVPGHEPPPVRARSTSSRIRS